MLDSLMAGVQRLRRQLSSDNFTLKRCKASRADEKKLDVSSIIKRKDLYRTAMFFPTVQSPEIQL